MNLRREISPQEQEALQKWHLDQMLRHHVRRELKRRAARDMAIVCGIALIVIALWVAFLGGGR